MASEKDIRTKIGSVKSTQKITNAMQMVAASKMRKAQDRMEASKPYAQRIREAVAHIAAATPEYRHRYMIERDVKRVGFIVVSSDRGLCGAFNANILRQAVEVLSECQNSGEQVTVSLVGRKSIDFFRRRSWSIRQEWPGVFDRLSYEHALDIGHDIVQQYNEGAFDQLYVVYNEFKSVMQQRVIIEKLLPIEALEEEGLSPESSVEPAGSYLYEPDEDELLKTLLPKHFEVQAFRVLLESAAAEQAARMTAMDGATRNAGELIKKVTLFYNKTRQAAITKELMDIVGGAEALK